jgi:ArsR family transcriptional regulator
MRVPRTVAVNLRKIGGVKRIRDNIPEERRANRVSIIFQSLSDPIRLSILYALSTTPLCVCVIKSLVKIMDSKLSYHLNNLRSARLVSRRREDKFTVYEITDLGRMLLSLCEDVGDDDVKRTSAR